VRLGILKACLGVGIALNGAVLFQAVDQAVTFASLQAPADMLAPLPHQAELVERMRQTCGLGEASLYEQCANGAQGMLAVQSRLMAASMQWAILHACAAGANLALLIAVLVMLARRSATPPV